ncbi:hypothetical protein [Bdellovibrio svalbardensis]|uniref:J domain-containing protein n=1 Tax=Bdellovibrio svalbardensis TaxID=2972972 RepID=A0ABT6DMZ9_9BACT|nr:hypothetical protein [Bdellovibrio svalbardensis]MDG0817877.1 hypothetical protein [Bdellovibrio svalbardensis]
MNSQELLTVNVVGAGAFILWYVLARGGGKRPTRLDMNAKDSAPPLITKTAALDSAPESKPELKSEADRAPAAPIVHPDLVGRKAKSLNVMFIYNGHSWDAYEVLGVPAGASIKTVTDAYQTALRRCDTQSVEFLETAYKAILNKGS